VARQTYIGLPVQDLARAREFYEQLGLSYDPRASDERSACMVISADTMVMLNAEPYFREFTGSEIADTSTAREVALGLSADTREQVDELTERAAAAGGRVLGGAVELGPMYMRAFLDPDGHRWSINYFAVPGR
jgi:uncharacterized protein